MPDMAKHLSLLPSNLIQISLTQHVMQHIMTILLSFLYPLVCFSSSSFILLCRALFAF